MKQFIKDVLNLYWYPFLNAVKNVVRSNSISLAALTVSCNVYDTMLHMHVLNLTRSYRRQWVLFQFAFKTGPMWWMQVCVCGIGLTTTLEHDEDEEGTIVGADKRVWRLSFNFLQTIKQETK